MRSVLGTERTWKFAWLVMLPAAMIVAACYSDNASPFVHGGKNAPSMMGKTKVPKSNTPPAAATSTAAYGGSSGYAGGIGRTPLGGVPSDTSGAAATPSPAPTAPAGAQKAPAPAAVSTSQP